MLERIQPHLGRSTYLLIRASSGRLSVELRRRYSGASRDEETRCGLGFRVAKTP